VQRRPKLAFLAAAAALVALAGCGAPYEDAQSFVDAANAEGAGFELGPSLSSSNPDYDIYALELEGAQDPHEGEEAGQAHLGGGSITVAPGEDEALAEYEECEAAATLLCWRAGNVTLVLEGEIGAEERARVSDAISALGSE
jgi:hypothetical protein